MKNFAVMSGTIVTNVIVANDLESAIFATKQECIEYTAENAASIGCTYNGQKFIAPDQSTINEALAK